MKTKQVRQAVLPLPLPPADSKEAYKRIRNFLAGRLVGATRDEALVEEVMKCLFCRALLVRSSEPTPTDAIELARVYRTTFVELKRVLPSVFDAGSEMLLDPTSIHYVDQQLADVDFITPTRDPIGDLYEAFIGSEARAAEGQFFTPLNAVQLLVDLVDPRPGERIIDPACGAGGFISSCARRLAAAGVEPHVIAETVFGVDKDAYLTRLATAHMGLATLMQPQVHCADSLAWTGREGDTFLSEAAFGTFDVVLANPPFGSKIISSSEEVQRRYSLGFKWSRGRTGRWERSETLQNSVPPQILFVERCMSLAKPGGRIGLVVPESLISGKSYRYVVQYIMDNAQVLAVFGMPETLFKTSGKGGTHTKTCLLVLRKRLPVESASQRIFMAEAQWCGHDSRGRTIDRDDLPTIAENFKNFIRGQAAGPTHLGYAVETTAIMDHVLAPRYYDPDVVAALETLQPTHDLVTVQSLVDQGVLEITTGHEVGKLAYGSGNIPFVRTSDISNWEVKIDPKHGVSDEVFRSVSGKQDVREGDILMVRDGTYLIGTCAYITKYDTRIVYQSHIYKIRVCDTKRLSPHLLLAVLSSPPVQRQIKAKRQTQDIIDTLGDRIHELVLPIPRDPMVSAAISDMVEKACRDRIEARELARRATLEVVGMKDEGREATL